MRENEIVEFKQELTKAVENEIIAFLNSYGGTIFIGYDDNGKLLGLKDAKADELALTSRIKNNIYPDATLFVSVEIKLEENKDYIVIKVSKGIDVYHLSSKGLYDGTYVRSGTTTILASKEGVKNLIMRSNNITFETSVSTNQELTFNYASKLFDDKDIDINDKAIQQSLNLRNSKGFLNLALLISDQNPFSIKVAVYPDQGKKEFLDRQEFTGSIFEIYDLVTKYLKLNSPMYGIIVGLKRQDTESFPNDILREAVLNSIIHRDYSIYNSNIINIYQKSNIEIINVGGIYGDLMVEAIISGVSSSRNPHLQSICLRLDLGDSLGKGLRTIFGYYKERDLEAKIQTTPASFILTLPKIQRVDAKIEEQNEIIIIDLTSEEAKEVILDYIKTNKAITRKIIEKLINKSKTTTGTILKELVDDSIIKPIGSGPSTKYILK